MSDAQGSFENLKGTQGSFGNEQPATQEAKPIESIVPPREDLITMTPEQLAELKQQIIAEATKAITEGDYFERMRVSLERDSALREVENKGQFADPALKVIRSGSLTPIDHQEATVAPFKTDPSKMYRVINKANEELLQLRRFQGYEPVKDADGNEVRYMDGVLAEMPKRKYEETIGAQVQARKLLKRQGSKNAANDFIEMGRRSGLKVEGDGVKVDVSRD